ncbi:hypothetical protein OKA05_00665 [Luteolibacter arcticus]|uniref:Uncharacterized protein n=1 Tax=Luteolibacter arcticus TaxID=1581411 RepID=A0ABT3GBP0_9BACT|nr:hypothetical protein [Luteolibacter arcticus]MCW1921044.1 hypothetical protein [Luteolibacter arcticus]
MKELYEKFADEIDGPASLQYAVVDGYHSLRSQATRDGWMNWSDAYEEMVDVLKAYLPDSAGREAERIRKDLDAIREAGQTGADEGRFGYEELDRLALDVIAWCERNEELILLPDGVDSWGETLGNANG